ncbi:MAG: ATP-dependent helicase, partial [Candidatus Krumholzibacteriia bacterium]
MQGSSPAGIEPGASMEETQRVLEELNAEQLRAVTAGNGALLVLAGAGSGKTRVLTTRIAHLVREHQVPAWRILAFTFTNKAAHEMRGRLHDLLGGQAADCWLGTFHATGVRILRREATRLGWQRSFAIYDSADSESVVKNLLSSRTMPRHLSPSEARHRIRTWKNDRIDPAAAAQMAADGFERAIAELYAEYEKTLRRNNAFDFDDLIVRPVELFEAEPETLSKYAERFLHVLVDEFQDTNGIQMRFIELLAGHHHNLCVVGDDDQSIYGWRGARIENILDFEKRFPDTRTIRLEQNYRSTTALLRAANGLIAHNRGRKGKNLWTSREGGDLVHLHLCHDEEEEATGAALLVQKLVADGRSRDEIAFLYRTNAQSRALEDALRRHNVPYQIVGGTRFYARRE